jgi:branched-chain amino acid transport system permease protein
VAFAQLSRIRLEYFPHGEGPEKVLLIHGFQSSGRIWRMVQEALPADRYTSIAVNNRGAGASEAPPDEAHFSAPIFAEDAFELVSQLGWRDFTLVGHSMGGVTAPCLAVEHPEALKGLVLLDPADPDGRVPPAGVSIDDLIDASMKVLRGPAAGDRAMDGIDASALGVPADMLRALAEDIRNAPERRLRGSLRSMFEVRLGERVKGLTMPILMVAGDADALIPISAMLTTWAKYPAGTGLHVWHGVGHSPNLDCPQALAAVLRRFIEETIPAHSRAS